MSNILSDFGSLLQQQFGSLGNLSSQTDTTAQRSYTEEGWFSTNPYNPTRKLSEIIGETPDITVFIKKRAFSSLAENYRTDTMDAREQAFYRTTKFLFQQKCSQIQNYERLTKLAQISVSSGQLNYYLLPILFTLTDNITQLQNPTSLGGTLGGLAAASLSGFSSIVDRVREITNLSQDNYNTTWITNLQNNFTSTLGQGTGVIELTNIMSIRTTSSIKFASGNFSMEISDPYNLMLVTNNDIEQAIHAASNSTFNSGIVQLGLISLNSTIALNKQQLATFRSSRGASPITFIVDTLSTAGEPVIAIIESTGFQIQYSGGSVLSTLFSLGGSSAVSIDPSALQGSSQAGDNGLSPQEATLFSEIISEINNQIELNNSASNQANTLNQDPITTYVRQKMRSTYGGKPVIQVMDNIHVYIRSYKTIDNKISGAIQTGLDGTFFDGLNNSEQNIADAFNLNNNYDVEKSIFVGDDFPSWLWAILRPWFISDSDGAHVFAGIVDKSASHYNSGVHNISVNGSDNAGYFKYGVVNLRPSLNVYNGSLYDPLTPFDLQFDSVTGAIPQTNPPGSPPLLDENKALFTSAFARYKNGMLAGIPPAQNSYMLADVENHNANDMRRVFYDPDGMVYRWKEGIAALPLFGDNNQPNNISLAVTTTKDPFAGQDIMNMLSLLICGEPYNYATFYKAVSQWDSYFSRDQTSNANTSTSYFRSLQSSLKYRNAIYGDFIPYKALVVDDQTYAKMLFGLQNAQGVDQQLQTLLQQRAALADKLNFLKAQKPTIALSTSQELQKIDLQISSGITRISNQLQSLNSAGNPITIVGNDISASPSMTLNSGSQQSQTDPSSRQALRRKTAFLTRRMSWKVRANEDINYLIVDDTYDKDYDIQAFEKAFVNPELFKSEYDTVDTQITNVADKLQLEVFANSQGHIEVRNPKYNKIPSSVLYNMFLLSDQLGIQLFPQFLADLYVSQIDNLQSQIEILEDQVRLCCLALGCITDDACEDLITGTGNSLVSSLFTFLTDEDTGTIVTLDITKITYQSDPDQVLVEIDNTLQDVRTQATSSAFDIATRANIIVSASSGTGTLNNPNQFSNVSTILAQASAQTRDTQITNRLLKQTGQTFTLQQIIGPGAVQSAALTSGEVLNITNQISTLLTQRQAAIQSFVKALQNTQESLQPSQDGSGGNQSLFPSLITSQTIPQVFESMIEDITYDDYGPGSGARFIIKNRDIISWTFEENRPQFTSVEVTGRLADNYPVELPKDLDLGGQGIFGSGNGLTTTAAVDYDLWRMYGLFKPYKVDAPMLTNPTTQCPIYAVSLLNKVRHEIFSGTMTLVGNEYQQPGEVIYVENTDKLFYVEQVSHSFDYGSGFTTGITLTMGHSPGEFIPTPLDVIGKILYQNKNITQFTHKKQGDAFNQQFVGAIAGNPNGLLNLTVPSDDLFNGPYGSANRASFEKIISASLSSLASATSNLYPMLEIRVFYNTNSAYSYGSPSSYATSLANAVKSYLISSSASTGATNASLNTSTNSTGLSAFSSQISVVSVDSNIGNSAKPSPPSSTQKLIDNSLYNYVVDCCIVFTNPNMATKGQFRYPSTQAYSFARQMTQQTQSALQ